MKKTPTIAICPHCSAEFAKRRKDQTYCTATCRKLTFQKKDRAANPQNSQCSQAKKRTNLEHFDTALRLAEMLYSLPLDKQLGFIKEIIDQARSGETKLRSILTNPEILYAPISKEKMFYKRLPEWHMTISQAADAYCWKFWNASVVDVVKGKVKEPETGEVFD